MKKRFQISESKINKIVEDTMDKFLQQQEQNKKWAEETKVLYTGLANFLTKSGVPGVNIHEMRSGSLCVSVGTDDYRRYNVGRLSKTYAESRHMYVTEDEYPATTYIYLNKY